MNVQTGTCAWVDRRGKEQDSSGKYGKVKMGWKTVHGN